MPTISERTAVPVVVAVAALGFGFWWGTREGDREKLVAAEVGQLKLDIASGRSELAIAKTEVIARIDGLASVAKQAETKAEEVRVASMTKEEFEAAVALWAALNPSVSFTRKIR